MVTETLRPTLQQSLIHFCANTSRTDVSTGEFCDSLGCPVKRGLIVLTVEIVAKLLTPGQTQGRKQARRAAHELPIAIR